MPAARLDLGQLNTMLSIVVKGNNVGSKSSYGGEETLPGSQKQLPMEGRGVVLLSLAYVLRVLGWAQS